MNLRTRRSKVSGAKVSFELARERYADVGVNTAAALKTLSTIPISLHCWQGDDVRGFEDFGSVIGGGLAVTGQHPGRARTANELRQDLEKALSLIPGNHRVNLHAMYGEFDGHQVDRDEIAPEHFRNWIAWAKDCRIALDFNATCFAHPKAADGFTLSHRDKAIRQFWIEHCRRSREIGATMGRTLGTACATNLWIPDGFKDNPADRRSHRELLAHSLDAVFKRSLPTRHNLDAVEGKLFGIGSESCTVGSHEFYLGYAITRRKLLCLDSGHFHPTETISDKISSVLQFMPEILLHVSRGIRWDSDHVVTFTEELLAIAREIIANRYEQRVRLGLDYFDASINRVAAWVIGARNLLRALLVALLEPPAIREAEIAGDWTSRLALQEEAKALPFGAVWDFYCDCQGVPSGERWLPEAQRYERDVLSKRN
jgi:L-rhamnose isomerase